MKTIYKVITFSLGVVFMLQSCNLDKEPSAYIGYEESFKTVEDAKKWDNGIYSTLRGKFGGGYVLPQEVQADMLNAHASFGSLYAPFHNWDVRSDDETLVNIYHSYYAALVDANVVIEKIPTLKPINDEQKEQLKQYLGNAYLARAFYHFNLALRWGQPYNVKEVATAQELCVPLALYPAPLEKPARATNEVAYKQILDDLQLAENNLVQMKGKEGSDEITVDVVKALRARVYLYMNDMENALKQSEELIKAGTYPLIVAYHHNASQALDPKTDPFCKMWNYDSGVEQIWQPHVDKLNEVPTTTPIYGADMATWQYFASKGSDEANNDFNKPSYLPTGEVVYDLYDDDDDHRAQACFEYVQTTVQEKEVQASIYVISKFKGNPEYSELPSNRWGGYVPNGIQAPKPFRIAEQYLIAAEAAEALGKADLALKYLNDLRLSRGYHAATTGDNLQEEIRKERARELAFEGFRLWDLRRWHLGINGRKRQGDDPRVAPIDKSFFAAGYPFNIQRAADDPKFVWGFPKDEVGKINAKVLQNKGWD